MEFKRYFFAIVVSIVLLVSVFSAGMALSAERTEDDMDMRILVHDRDIDTEFLFMDPGYRVIEQYDSYLLVETSLEDMQSLEDRGYIVEELKNRDYVGLQSYSFHTGEGEPEIPEDLEIAGYPNDGRGYYILQFIGPIRQEWKESLEEEGVELHEFRHRFNFLVEMDLQTMRSVEEKDFVNWIGIYHPAYRFDRDLLEKSGTVTLDVSIFESADPRIVASEIARLGGDIHFIGEGRINLEIDAERITNLANFHNVKSITEGVEEYELLNADATWVSQTNEQDNRKVTEEGVTGEGQLITVMDSELNVDHEAFDDPDGDPIGDDHRKIQEWYVPADAGGDLEAGIYHGTHVTGTVLGESPTYGEYSNHDGNALEARVIFQDVSDDACGSVSPPSDMYNDGYGQPYDWGARAHTNSWGGGSGYGDSAITSDEFIWDHKDFNILYAMGNDGDGANTISAQAEAKNIFSVGSVTNAPSQDDVSGFSSRGYADDGRIKPTVMHVGENLMSADDGDNTGYSSMSGTSMSTPGIAGQVGQVRHYYEGGWYPDGIPDETDGFNPSSALVKASIVNGAVEISGSGAYNNDNRFPNNDQGFGRSQLDRVLHFEGDSRELEVFDSWNEGIELGTGESWDMNFEVIDQHQDIEVTLVWSDYPGSSGSDSNDPAIVNDLDLEVTDPDGTRYVGNAFTGSNPGYSEPDPTSNPWDGLRGEEYDGLNVVENVLLLPDQNGVEEGTYEVTVTGHQVPEESQPFAVVISGGITQEIPGEPPEIDLTRPDGGETFDANTDEEITWDTVEGDDPVDEINLWYSKDSGSSWDTIVSGLGDTGSYSWTVPNVDSSDCLVRARATDTEGRVNEDTSSETFTIVGVPPSAPENLDVEHYGMNESWEWLYQDPHRDEPDDGRGITGEGTFFGAMRKEVQADDITELAYYAWDEADYVKGYIHEDGDGGDNPGELLGETDSIADPGPQEWIEIEFSESVSVDGGYYWVILEVGDPGDEIGPFGSYEDYVEDNAWISLDGSTWEEMTDHDLEYNWALEVQVRDHDETGDDHNKISWDASIDDEEEVDHYNLYRSEEQSGPWDESTLVTEIEATGAQAYEFMDEDKGEADDIYWWYVVRAVGENGVEDENDDAVQEPGGIPAPVPPIDPEPGDGTTGVSTDVDLSVHIEHEEDENMDVSFYDAFDDSLIGTDENVPSGERAEVSWSGLDMLTTYEWYVVSEDDNEMTAESDTWWFETAFEPENGAHELMGYFIESYDGEAVFYDGSEYYGNVSVIELEDPGNVAINEGTGGSWQDSYGGFAWDTNHPDYGWSDSPPDFGNNIYFVNEVPEEDVAGDAGYVWTSLREVDGDIVASPQESMMGQYEQIPTPIERSAGDDWIEIEVESPAYTDWDNEAEMSPGMGTYDEFVSYSVFASGGEYEEWTYIGDTESLPEEEYDGDYEDPIEPWNEGTDPEDVTTGMNTLEVTDLDPGDYQFKVRMNIGEDLSGGYAGGYDNAYTTWASGAPSETMVIEGDEYTLEIDVEGEGTVEVDGEVVETPYSEEYWEGTDVELNAIPEEGWEFNGWTGAHDSEEEQITVTMDEDKALTANFVDPDVEHELAIDAEGEGTVEVDGVEVELPYSEEHQEGTEVTLTAVPDEGWLFDGWTGDYESEEEEIFVIIDEDKTLTANFREHDPDEEHELVIDVEGEGTVEVDGVEEELPFSEIYTDGAEVELTAVAYGDWQFSHWQGDYPAGEQTETTIQLVMDDDRTLTAYFEHVDPTIERELTISVEGDGTTTPEPGDHTYYDGEAVLVTATPDEGFIFNGWTGDRVSDQEEITLVMDSDKQITALFEEDEIGEAYFEVWITSPEDGTEFENGEEIVVEYAVENTGDALGTKDVEFVVEDELIETEEDVRLGPGESDDGYFLWEAEEEGEIELMVRTVDDQEVVESTAEITISVDEDEVGLLEGEGLLCSWWWLILLLIIVILILVIVVIARRGDDEEIPEDEMYPQGSMPPPPPPSAGESMETDEFDEVADEGFDETPEEESMYVEEEGLDEEESLESDIDEPGDEEEFKEDWE